MARSARSYQQPTLAIYAILMVFSAMGIVGTWGMLVVIAVFDALFGAAMLWFCYACRLGPFANRRLTQTEQRQQAAMFLYELSRACEEDEDDVQEFYSFN